MSREYFKKYRPGQTIKSQDLNRALEAITRAGSVVGAPGQDVINGPSGASLSNPYQPSFPAIITGDDGTMTDGTTGPSYSWIEASPTPAGGYQAVIGGRQGFVGTTGTVTIVAGAVTAVVLDQTAGGYTSAPTVTIIGDGTGATATAVLTGDVVTSVTIGAGGSGYTQARVIFTGGGAGGGRAYPMNTGQVLPPGTVVDMTIGQYANGDTDYRFASVAVEPTYVHVLLPTGIIQATSSVSGSGSQQTFMRYPGVLEFAQSDVFNPQGDLATVTADIASGSQTVTPDSMVGIATDVLILVVGQLVVSGVVTPQAEFITVTAATSTTFTATFANAYTGPTFFYTAGVWVIFANGKIPNLDENYLCKYEFTAADGGNVWVNELTPGHDWVRPLATTPGLFGTPALLESYQSDLTVFEDVGPVATVASSISAGPSTVTPSSMESFKRSLVLPVVCFLALGRGGVYGDTPPTLTIAGGGGSGATATVALDGLGRATNPVTITNAGSGYTSQPTCTPSSGDATFVAYINGSGQVSLIDCTFGGSVVQTSEFTYVASNTSTTLDAHFSQAYDASAFPITLYPAGNGAVWLVLPNGSGSSPDMGIDFKGRQEEYAPDGGPVYVSESTFSSEQVYNNYCLGTWNLNAYVAIVIQMAGFTNDTTMPTPPLYLGKLEDFNGQSIYLSNGGPVDQCFFKGLIVNSDLTVWRWTVSFIANTFTVTLAALTYEAVWTSAVVSPAVMPNSSSPLSVALTLQSSNLSSAGGASAPAAPTLTIYGYP
jgi:hypothetical protein